MPAENPNLSPLPKWNVLLETIRTAQSCFQQWITAGKLGQSEAQEIIGDLNAQYEKALEGSRSGAPLPQLDKFLPLQANETPGVRGYRSGMFMMQLLRDLWSEGRLPLASLHALKADVRARFMAVQRTLVQEGIPMRQLELQCSGPGDRPQQQPGEKAGSGTVRSDPRIRTPTNAESESVEPPQPRRKLMEIILDPRSIQCLLGLGGALMVVGLVILLWMNNFFTPPVMAVVLATGNLVLLAAGLATVRFSRYQLAGKAVSLLSCLVMPLNLWYCHSNNLITIDGHLWVCAVVISAIYGLAAVVLKDEMFVYVFSAGVSLTGLLILADLPPSPQKFREIASPATLLVVLGLISIHLIQAFNIGEGPFSRERFGMAFFWSGHVQIAAGLILVLGAQVAGDWMYPFWFKPLYDSLQATPSPICNELRWLALILVLSGTYAYTYSDLAVRKKGIFLHIGAFTLLWAEVLVVQVLDLKLGVDAIIAILATTSLLSHLAQSLVGEKNQYTRSLPVFGLLLGALPAVIGTVVYLDHMGLQAVWIKEPPRWAFVGAMILTAVACRVGSHVHRGTARLMTAYFFATGAATMIAAVAALAALGMNQWQSHAPIMMLIPIAYLVASRIYGDTSQARAVLWVGHAAAGVMLISSLSSAFMSLRDGTENLTLHLTLSLFFAEAALFYGLATWFRRQPWCVYLSSLMASAACWQLLVYFQLGTEAYILAFAVAGLAMLIAYRFSLLEQTPAAQMAVALFESANAVLSLAFVSSVFYGLSQYQKAGDAIDWGFAGFCFAMLAISVLATLITRHPAGHRWYTVTTCAQGAVTLLAVHKLIDLHPWQQVELFSVLAGLLLLGFGHIGWYREQEEQSESVSTSLLLGALLASVPLAIATWIDRGHGVFRPINEFGFLFVSVALLASGMLFQLKATTIIGGAMTVLYFLTLAIFVPWSRLNAVAVAITVGGGVVFAAGLILAFFRDSLLTLPDRIQRREGIFRIFNWR